MSPEIFGELGVEVFKELDLRADCIGDSSVYCRSGTFCDWLNHCKPKQGRFGGQCSIKGTKCDMEHSVCGDQGCLCEDGYKPNRTFDCVALIAVLSALALVLLLMGLGGFFRYRKHRKSKKESVKHVKKLFGEIIIGGQGRGAVFLKIRD
ncbi:hypothetical protein ACOMHN_027520 [Nucella lapillus]